jgi:predicted metal-dependent HD superfamily phosphohydrolase
MAELPLAEQWRFDMSAHAAPWYGPVFNEIIYRHAETHRRYHGVQHLEALFQLLRLHAPHLPPGCPARLAVWWHDSIYDPQARDNEECSAELARQHLIKLGISHSVIGETLALILKTKNHWSGPAAGDGDYFLDADIAILGAPSAIYDRYAADVRTEYRWAPDDAYRAGRSAFLSAAIARPQLFRTATFQNAFDRQARINMRRELDGLK